MDKSQEKDFQALKKLNFIRQALKKAKKTSKKSSKKTS